MGDDNNSDSDSDVQRDALPDARPRPLAGVPASAVRLSAAADAKAPAGVTVSEDSAVPVPVPPAAAVVAPADARDADADTDAASMSTSVTAVTAPADDPSTLWARFSEGLAFLVQRARSKLHNQRLDDGAQDLLRLASRYTASARSAAGYGGGNGSSSGSGGQVTLLASTYAHASTASFLEDFYSRIWVTYRRGFPPITPGGYTSDAGWGCMLRSGQMMLASAFMVHELGRDWRMATAASDTASWLKYTQIVARFLDVHASPYSIHKIALLGRQFDKQVGEWFGPSTISQVLRVLVNSDEQTNLRVVVANDGVVYKNEVRQVMSTTREDGRPTSLLLLVPLRLGVDSMNPIYHPGLKHCFTITNCVGIAGGRPNSSLFFIGTDGDNLMYLDPHYQRPSVECRDVSLYKMEDLLSYHCETVRLLPLSSMDPSLVIGFYCKDIQSFEALCVNAEALSNGQTPLFTIEEDASAFEAEVDVLSDDDL
ncbi:hypothetical protein BC831DRAFT_463067 [Entophlyctis helioformis]|nr:hypothetical protein BC831DRAFT_463067 [Entophlyctis helioformis]